MTYVPHNQSVFIAAYAGALAGMGANERNPTSPLPASYLEIIESAGAFAQRFDTVYSGSTMSAQIVAIQHLCHAAWAGRLPIAPTFFVPSAYVELCNALIALVNEFTSYFTSNAIPPTSDVLEMYYSTNWAVADWYIDGTVGVDSNDGLTAATPIKTGVELQRRLGPYARWNHSVTIHVLANGMTDPLIVKGELSLLNTHLDIIGEAKDIITDTLTSYVAPVYTATPNATQITGTTILDFTPYIWKRIRITSGARTGWTSWIAKSNPNGVGVNTARCSPGIILNETLTTSIFTTNAVPANGDVFKIETLPSIPSISIILDCTPNLSDIGIGAQYPLRSLLLRNIDCQAVSITSPATRATFRSCVFGCRVKDLQIYGINNTDTQTSSVAGCLFSTNYGSTTSATCVMYAPAYFSLVGDGITNVSLLGSVNRLQNTLIQGAYVSSIFSYYLQNCQVFDSLNTTFGAITAYGEQVYMVNCAGDGNIIGLGLHNGTKLIYASNCNVNGVTQVRLMSAPAIALTRAQAFLPDDYEQKGTATLVAGTVTVTVPWYDNTVQKVTATHNTFGGTPGILSVQKISNSQFTITSLSNLDTSTVDWQISPLGRDISIIQQS